MQGKVFQIASPRYGNQPHLYVVVLEFSGNQDCIVVPAFSAEGYMVNRVIQARLDEGYRIDQVAVELDNVLHVRFVTQHSGKLAHWLVSDADRIPLSGLSAHVHVGAMDQDGLIAIARGLLNFAGTTERFSATVLKRLRKLAGE